MTAAFPNGLYILDHQIELGQRSTTLHSNIFTSKLIKKSNAEQCMIMKTFTINVTIWRSQIIQLHVHQPHAIDSVMSPPSPRQIAACVPASIFSPAICICTPLHNFVNHHHTIQKYTLLHIIIGYLYRYFTRDVKQYQCFLWYVFGVIGPR